MKKVEIIINGKAYPCRQTMGAMLRFKRETGRDVSEMKNDVSDTVTFLWCCVCSACAHDGIAFDLPLLDFADGIDPATVEEWAAAIGTENEGGGEKKSSPG